MSARELRNQTGLSAMLAEDDEVVLTVHGKPIAILVETDEETLDETIRSMRRARAQAALARMRRNAKKAGVSSLTEEEMAAEIQASRAAKP
ncbi:MAG: prevent-host-death protein [Candidatus Schekmanbacteria bacterium]|nr:prevent-host-death protein [Candidatus Schekmanbacteria bacterium]